MASLSALSLAAGCSVCVGEGDSVPKVQTITVKARGLYDSGNNPWTLPDGALLEAMNVEIGRDNASHPRRGLAAVTNPAAMEHLFRFGTAFLGHSWASSFLYRTSDLGTTWTAGSTPLSAFTADGSGRMFSAESAKSLFIASSAGVMSLDTLAGTPRRAGVAPATEMSLQLAGAGTAVPNNTRVAYRYVYGRKDANGRILLGAPSSRVVLTNTAGSVQDVIVTVNIPAEVNDGTHFVQVYRTSASVDQNTDPGDECYLVYEFSQGNAGINATSTVTDSTPDGLGGALLYTSPSQETILAGNERPPLSYDVAEYGGAMWYGDVTFPARGTLHLLGVSGASGLANGDTITINGTVFTATTPASGGQDVALRHFLLSNTLGVDGDMRATTTSLVVVVNRNATLANVFATDISEPAPSGIPGNIALQNRDLTSTLTVTVSRATAWSPSAGLSVAPIRTQNGVVYSKQGQPDAIATAVALSPLLVGSANQPVMRIVPTRNSLWVLKADGIWRVTGSAGQYDVQPFDPTTAIRAPRSAVPLDNQVYFWSDQGIVRVSETGVELVSRPIEATLAMYQEYAFGSGRAVARETDHKYILWVHNPSLASPLTDRGFVFDILTQAWTERDDANPNDALVALPTNQMFLLNQNGAPFLERGYRPSNLRPVFVDSSQAVTLAGGATSIGGGSYSIQIGGSATVVAGDLLIQGAATATISVSSNGSILTVRDVSGTFTAATATVYASYPMTVTYAVKSSTPGTTAEWQEAALLFGNVDGDTATVTLTGDSGSDPPISIDKTANPGEARQIRIWPGRASAYSGIMKLSYSERVGYATRATELAGVAWTVLPGGDGVSR